MFFSLVATKGPICFGEIIQAYKTHECYRLAPTLNLFKFSYRRSMNSRAFPRVLVARWDVIEKNNHIVFNIRRR